MGEESTDRYNGGEVRPEHVEEMRVWLLDCSWGDLDEEAIAELSERAVVRGVARHYAGGVAQFITDGG